MSLRSNMCIMVAGRKHTGKSTWLRKLMDNYPKNKRALVVDVNGSPAYADLPEVTYANFSEFHSGARRMYDPDTRKLMQFLAKNMRNGLLIFEDCTKYIPSNLSPLEKTIVTDHRMSNLDVVFTFHALRRIPLQFWEMATDVVIKKTQENIIEDKSFFVRRIPNGEAVVKAWEKVTKAKSEFATETVKTLI